MSPNPPTDAVASGTRREIGGSGLSHRPLVLVTGASTGIGRATALLLADHGFDVLAGVRTDAAASALRRPHVHPVLLDVTDPETIKAAVEEIHQSFGGRLVGLVNNAGIAAVGPLELVPLERLRLVVETNLVGAVAVTQAMLPMLRATGGRVVFMSSVSGRAAAPFLGPYAATKHAIEAVGDAWRRELAPLGVRVSLIEPGNIDTPIWGKGLDPAGIEALGPDAEGLYGAGLAFALDMGRRSAGAAIAPDHVAEAVRRALVARRPRARYVVGPDARITIPLARHAPRLMDRAMAALMARHARRRTHEEAAR